MNSHTYSYVVGIAGFLYGSFGYGLSIITYIFGAALRRFSPESTRLSTPKPPIISRGRRSLEVPAHKLGSRQSRGHSSHSPTLGASKSSEAVVRGTPTPDVQLRRVASLDSFDRPSSFVLVAPVITINHVERVDNMSIKAPTITIHPGFCSLSEEKHSSKRPSLTMADQSSLPLLSPLPHFLPPTEGPHPGSAFRLSSLKPLLGTDKPKIHRSASSPQLAEFSKKKVLVPESKQNSRKEKTPSSRESNKKASQQDKSADFVTHQSTPSKFFSAFPKNVAKKRSQTLRTQPYNAPYFVPPPVPPIPSSVRRGKEVKRGKTLPAEKRQRPSTAPQNLSLRMGTT